MLWFKKGVMLGNKFRIFNNSKEVVICVCYNKCELFYDWNLNHLTRSRKVSPRTLLDSVQVPIC